MSQNFLEISAPFLVIFRESLEIVLIVGIVLAATKGLPGRTKWSLIGAGGGIAGSLLVALFTSEISAAADGLGQELMNGSILLAAALMIGWTVVWMKHHAREMHSRFKQLSSSINEGTVPLYSLAVVIALAMLREGSEMVLFTYGMLTTGMKWEVIMEGAILGVIAGSAVGILFYLGLTRVFTKHFFNFTSWLLALLASGLAAESAAQFAAAGILPELGTGIWDTSALLSDQSALGFTLKILVGYSANPSGIQLATYLTALAMIAFFMTKTPKLKTKIA